jgi:hypothetical protein
MIRYDSHGRALVLFTAAEGELFAEAALFSERRARRSLELFEAALRVEWGAWSVAYTVAWSIAVIAWSIAAVIACSVAAVIAWSIAVMSVPVMVAAIPHALA